MPKMSLFKKVTAAIMIVLTSAIFAIPVVQASQPRDNDSNAILYGGAYTITELISKVNSGNTKGPHQTSAELKKLYSTVGMDFGWFGQLQSGTIYKDGHVTLNGKTVATRVQTMGRHYISGSTQDTRLPYPVYWRNPSVSFNSNSLPAWIFMNYDGTMGFGIVKSCGNPIKAAGVKVKPTPKFTLTIRKFDDRNGNRVKDTGESQLSGWRFTVTGPNTNTQVTTDKNGNATVANLGNGTYTVREIQVSGWSSTTGLTRTVVINGRNTEVWFGNRRIPITPSARFSIIAKKYEDMDADAIKDGDEKFIEGWRITLTGNVNGTAIKQEFLTDSDGEVHFSDLQAGTYTITEEQRAGWKNITPLSQTVAVPSATGADPVVEFGNQKIKTVTPQGTPALPVSGPVDAIAGTMGIISLGGAGSYYLKGKKSLLSAVKKIK